MEKLSIFTLDYTNSHFEYAIHYWTNEWELLVDLLEDPYEFFIKRQNGFDIERLPLRAKNWALRRPVSAVLRYAKGSKSESAKFFSQAELSQDKFNSFMRSDTDILPEGGFMAEFAINTRTLLITYCPPKKPKDNRYRDDEGFSRVNLSLADKYGEGDTYGTLHFDLGGEPHNWSAENTKSWTMEYSRARFAVAWAEGAGALLDKLTKHAATDGNLRWYQQEKREMTANVGGQPLQSINLDVDHVLTIEQRKDLKFLPDVRILTEVISDEEAIEFLVVPNLYIEGLSETRIDGPIPPCLQAHVYVRDGVTYVNDAILKAYVAGPGGG